MKATIYLNNKVIFSSDNISSKKLEKVENELKLKHGCMLMADRVKKGFKVFASKQTQNYFNFKIMKTTKKQLVAQLIEKYEQNGYPIKNFIGKPLSYFDEEKVKNLLQNKHFFKC